MQAASLVLSTQPLPPPRHLETNHEHPVANKINILQLPAASPLVRTSTNCLEVHIMWIRSIIAVTIAIVSTIEVTTANPDKLLSVVGDPKVRVGRIPQNRLTL
jgi:hypothetical protein